MVFCVDFIALTTLTTAMVTTITHVAPDVLWWFHVCILWCSTCTVPHSCSVTSCVRILQCSVCTTVCMVIGRSICQHFTCTVVSCMYVPQRPTWMYCSIPHGCTTYHIYSAKKKVVTQIDTSFITLTDDSQGNPRVYHTQVEIKLCSECIVQMYRHIPHVLLFTVCAFI